MKNLGGQDWPAHGCLVAKASLTCRINFIFQEAVDEPAKAGPSTVEASVVNVGDDDDDDEDVDTEPTLKRKRFGKNPDVDTSFLPDVERDEEENRLREKLRQVRAGIRTHRPKHFPIETSQASHYRALSVVG